MKKNFNDPRGGLIIALGVLLAALWLVIAFGAYEELKREKYEVRVKPGAVTYGTHSTTTIPMSSVSTHRSAVPMISGGAIRHYAHYGHATMPKMSGASNYRLHTTSSATVHSVGGGGAGGGGAYSAGGGSSSSSRGINYSGASVSMPTLAMATSTYATSRPTFTSSDETLASASSSMRKVRKAKPSSSGEDGEWRNGGEGESDWWWYDEYEGDWIQVTEGDSREAGGGNYWKYNGSTWDLVDDHGNPVQPQPIGDAPWHWMLLLMAVYGGAKVWKRNKTKNLI